MFLAVFKAGAHLLKVSRYWSHRCLLEIFYGRSAQGGCCRIVASVARGRISEVEKGFKKQLNMVKSARISDYNS